MARIDVLNEEKLWIIAYNNIIIILKRFGVLSDNFNIYVHVWKKLDRNIIKKIPKIYLQFFLNYFFKNNNKRNISLVHIYSTNVKYITIIIIY